MCCRINCQARKTKQNKTKNVQEFFSVILRECRTCESPRRVLQDASPAAVGSLASSFATTRSLAPSLAVLDNIGFAPPPPRPRLRTTLTSMLVSLSRSRCTISCDLCAVFFFLQFSNFISWDVLLLQSFWSLPCDHGAGFLTMGEIANKINDDRKPAVDSQDDPARLRSVEFGDTCQTYVALVFAPSWARPKLGVDTPSMSTYSTTARFNRYRYSVE